MVLEAQQGAGTTMRHLRCDVAWLYRIDNSYVDGARAKSQSKKGESQNGWEEEDDFWRSQSRSRYQSPRATQRKKASRRNGRRIASKRTFLFLRQIPVGTPIRQATHQRRERHLLRQRNNFTDLYVPLKKQDEPVSTEVQQIMANTDLQVTLTKGLTVNRQQFGKWATRAQSLRGCTERQVEPSGCVNGCRCEKGGHQAERCGVFDRHFSRVCHRSCGQIRNHQGDHQLHGRNPGADEEVGRSCIHRRRTQTQEAAHGRPEGRIEDGSGGRPSHALP